VGRRKLGEARGRMEDGRGKRGDGRKESGRNSEASGAAYMKLHKIKKANRRISNIEPQNVEGWNRFAQFFLK